MAEEKEKNGLTTAPAVAETSVTAPMDPALCPPEEKPQMSAGEKWYNRLVYQGLNYWINLGLSLYVTDLFVHGGGRLDPSRGRFRAFFDRHVHSLTEKITATKMLSHKSARRFSEILLSTFTLNSGGNILLIPTKILEDNKRPMVHWLNKKLGVDMRAPDGHEETADEIYIEQEQPPQGILRMVWRRLQGLAATTAAGLFIDYTAAAKLDKPEMRHGDVYTHKPGQENFTDNVVEGIRKIPSIDRLMKGNQTADRYIKYASLDWIYTIITSRILHKTNGAKPAHTSKEIDHSGDPTGHIEQNRVVIDAPKQRSYVETAPKPGARKDLLNKIPPASISEKVKNRAGETDLNLAP